MGIAKSQAIKDPVKAADIQRIYNVLAIRINAMDTSGTFANRPVAIGSQTFYYATDENALYYDDTSATWRLVIADSFARLTGDVTSNSATLVNITGLSLALLVNSVYVIEAVLQVKTATISAAWGIQYSVAGGGISAQTHCLTSTDPAVVSAGRISALNTAVPLTAAGVDAAILIKGIVTTGANAGNLTVQHSANGGGGTVTCYSGSYLKISKIA